MNSQEINEKALSYLSAQNWMDAQILMFENANKYPSYQTYNNLGYYLISEGFTCENGETRSAFEDGFKYLLESSKIKTTIVNLCALAKYADYRSRDVSEKNKTALYSYACDCLKKAISIKYTDELKYNYLRFSYLAKNHYYTILLELKELLKSFISSESISLYFQILRDNSIINEGLQCIQTFGDFLDEVDLLMFYSRFGFYENGYILCDTIYDNFSINKNIASAIIECCVNTNRFEDAKKYAHKIKETEDEIKYESKENWFEDVFNNLKSSTSYRKAQIEGYKYIPPIIEHCCYFGCAIHGTHW